MGDDLSDPAYAAGAVAALVGDHEQVPPAYAAIKVDGRKAYDLARQGRGARDWRRGPSSVHRARLLSVDAGPPVSWDLALDVSKGTYVRAIARDLGTAHGTVAHLSALRRTRVGALQVDDAVSWEELEAAIAAGRRARAGALPPRSWPASPTRSRRWACRCWRSPTRRRPGRQRRAACRSRPTR